MQRVGAWKRSRRDLAEVVCPVLDWRHSHSRPFHFVVEEFFRGVAAVKLVPSEKKVRALAG